MKPVIAMNEPLSGILPHLAALLFPLLFLVGAYLLLRGVHRGQNPSVLQPRLDRFARFRRPPAGAGGITSAQLRREALASQNRALAAALRDGVVLGLGLYLANAHRFMEQFFEYLLPVSELLAREMVVAVFGLFVTADLALRLRTRGLHLPLLREDRRAELPAPVHSTEEKAEM